MSSAISWHTEKRKCCDLELSSLELSSLAPCSYNPRKMNDRGKVDLTKSRTLSFKMFNLAEIPVINLNNQILVGHMRIAILIELGRGDELIDVRVPNKQLSK